MSTMTVTQSGRGGGRTFNQTANVTVGREIIAETTVTPAKTGNLTTRTSDTVGTLTMATGHGITDAARLDLYWIDPTTQQVKLRFGVVVGTVVVNDVPISGGSGDNLPLDESAITAMVPTPIDLDFIGTGLKMILASVATASGAIFAFVDGTETELNQAFITQSGAVYSWYTERDRYHDANRLDGDTVAKVYFSHNDSAASRLMRLVLGLA